MGIVIEAFHETTGMEDAALRVKIVDGTVYEGRVLHAWDFGLKLLVSEVGSIGGDGFTWRKVSSAYELYIAQSAILTIRVISED